MNRDDFLQKYWQKYPLIPQEAKVYGRVKTVGKGSLELQGRSDLFDLSGLRLVPLSVDGSWSDVLRENDWVALTNSEIWLLAPALEKPLPLSSSQDLQRRWGLFLQTVREFFYSRQFIEITTPSLVVCPGTEPFLDYFSTDFIQGSQRQKFFLPTSPELHLKKALADGYEKIFEIKTCYRNGEISATHQPEFQMLEWYRAGNTLQTIKADVETLVQLCAERLQVSIPSASTVSMQDLFSKHLGFSLTPQTSQQQLLHLARAKGLSVGENELWDDLFYRLYLDFIEPHLQGALFVEKYPPSQAALARLTEDGWGDRFEFYLGELEIANAFHELNDPRIQAQRFEEDLAKKSLLKKEVPGLDEEFLRALRSGMPPSAGIALGLERLFMALTGKNDIAQLRLFPMRSISRY